MLTIHTNTRHFVGEISSKGLKEISTGDVSTIEIHTGNKEHVATIEYEQITEAEFLKEVAWAGNKVRRVIKVTSLELCDNDKYIEEFLNSIYEIFMESLNVMSWGLIYIPLSMTNLSIITRFEDKIFDCSHELTINNKKDKALLLFL